LYVEDVFSTYVYAGNSTAGRAIVNGIDLSGEGGMVWHKRRTGTGSNHALYDTERGATKNLRSNQTNAESTSTGGLTSFNSNGFTYGTYQETGYDYASWTFRKAEKFFDVVTYTGDGVTGRTVAHNLGSTPSCIIIKRTDSAKNWTVYHSGLNGGSSPESYSIHLNLSEAQGAYGAAIWNSTAPSGSVFTLGSSDLVNASGGSYVAYVFASDAGGFGDDGDENIIKCGTYNNAGSAWSVDLGFEPQWVLRKLSNGVGSWQLTDNMRGLLAENGAGTAYARLLKADSSNAENNAAGINITSTGINGTGGGDTGDYIYMAIRRPMKTPESGTEVFAIDDAANGLTSGFPVDWFFRRTLSSSSNYAHTRLCGETFLTTDSTDTEQGSSPQFDNNTGVYATLNNSAIYGWMFKRATGFFDVVAYSGNSVSGRTVNHGLKVIPEFIIIKAREASRDWVAYTAPTGAGYYLKLNDTQASAASSGVFPSAPTDSVFSLGSGSFVNSTSSGAYIAYLFATVSGVSKVGSYTGTGSNVDVDCGFSAGARFILIKRTDSTGDWYVWDTERGITAGNDPYLLLNTTAAEVTSTDYIDPLASGFTVTSSAPAALNASGGSYIFLAIA